MPLFTFSSNPSILPDMTKKEAARKSGSGWVKKQVEFTEKEMENLAKTETYLVSEVRDGKRNKNNVKEVFFIALDFDEGTPTIDEFKSMSSRWQFSWFLHTTTSHQKKIIENGEEVEPKDKFRVLIPLKRTITRSQLKSMASYWEDMFPYIDASCFEAERFYAANPNAICLFHEHLDPMGGTALLDPDYILDIVAPQSTSTGKVAQKQAKSTKDEKNTISNNDFVKTSDGREIQISDIDSHTSVFCPFCIHDHQHRSNPESANAFVDLNILGNKYLYCSSEGKTYWQRADEVNQHQTVCFLNVDSGLPALFKTKRISSSKKSTRGKLEIKRVQNFKNTGTDFENWANRNKVHPQSHKWLPRYEVIFDPGLPPGPNLEEEYLNLFTPTEYLLEDHSDKSVIDFDKGAKWLKENAFPIYRILDNIFANDEHLNYYINWLSTLVQDPNKKLNTAWLITSKEKGVGKGLMFDQILAPIFGDNQVQLLDAARMFDRFNALDQTCWIRGYDEVYQQGNPKANNAIKEKLKHLITTNTMTLEKKYQDAVQADNFMNYILLSNSDHPILIEEGDRRYYVIRNPKALRITRTTWWVEEYGKNVKRLQEDIQKHLPKFSELLHRFEYHRDKADEAIDTTAKHQLIMLSRNEFEKFSEALQNGDADYFMLDDIFHTSGTDLSIGGMTESEKKEWVEYCIRDLNGIPASYMKRIAMHHFSSYSTYKGVLNKLKYVNIVSTAVYIPKTKKSEKLYKRLSDDEVESIMKDK